MKREIAIGLGLAAATFAVLQGLDVTPLVLVGALFGTLWFLRDGRGLGKPFRVVNEGDASAAPRGVTFDDIGGQEVAKRELLEALEFLREADKVRRMGIRPLKGVLLAGPPGTGKTLMAKAAATYTDSVFVAASGSQFVEVYAGVGAQRVRQLFRQARTLAKERGKKSAIVFVDEMDVLGGKRGQHTSHLEYDQTLNQLLVEMDGIDSKDPVRVLVVGATNRVDLLDPALLRPGRFDRVVRVDLPDRPGRLHILRIHTRGKPLAPGVDLEALARDTFGFSGAHLESLVNEAAIHAMRAGRDQVTMDDFRDALDKVMMGERLDRKPTSHELHRVAVHEIGHAIISELVRPGSVSVVTVTSRGQALGYMRQAPQDDRYLYTVEELEGQMAVALGGSGAEMLVFGSRSTGSTGDFEQAVDLARKMVFAGLSPLGVVSREHIPPQTLHEAIQELVAARQKWVEQQLEGYRQALESAARWLVQNERITGEQLRRLLGWPAAGRAAAQGAATPEGELARQRLEERRAS